MDGRIELLYIQHVGGDALGIAMAFASSLPCPLIDQPQHAFLDKTAGFVPDGLSAPVLSGDYVPQSFQQRGQSGEWPHSRVEYNQ